MAVSVTSGGEQTGHAAAVSSQRARLYWQCRRGMLELDLVLQAFLDHRYEHALPDERRAFEALLNYPDALLFEYIMGRVIPTDGQLAHVIKQLRGPTPA
jgi:antitoxin CptB